MKKICETCIYYCNLCEVAGLCELCNHLVHSDDEYECWEGEEDES